MKTSSLVWLLVVLVLGGVLAAGLLHESSTPVVTQQERSVRNVEPEAAQTVEKQIASQWVIVPGKSFGKITASTTRKSLADHYGEENVKDEDLYVGEGFYEKGTVLFPQDKLKRAEIFWEEGRFGEKISLIRLSEEKTLWHTPEGVTIGTSMKALEKLNGGPFQMNGFGWDYGGNANLGSDKPGGPLQGIAVRLSEGDYEALRKRLSEKEINSVMGDQLLSTSDPVLQKINPTAYQVFVSLD